MHRNVYTHTLGTLCSVLDAYSTVLFLADPPFRGGTVFRLAGKFSLGDFIDPAAVIEPGKGLVGWIAKNNAPLLVPNFDQRKNHLGYYKENEELRIKAFMGCSLPDGQGVLCVDSKRQYSFSDKDQKLLHLFAQLIAEQSANFGKGKTLHTIGEYYSALKEVYTLRRRHSRWADFLREFLGLMVSATGCDYGVFCYNDTAANQYVVEGETAPLVWKPRMQAPAFSVNSGAIGWVCRNGEALFSNAPGGMPESSLFGKGVTTPQFQTVMALPLQMQRKTRGVLCLAKESPLPITEDTQDFVRMASEHLALFLENLYIKCRLRDVSAAATELRSQYEHNRQELEPEE
ncbi:GAF domain protein [uncultured delta proteobacterium]|uniref:GAF domain protein n=1 Tax=uncultured delta proteobacterium TaxID=34034 RepID=A0A212J4C3_9DELT|nr:GAF domain protein [uncultured delta proteobacterium]